MRNTYVISIDYCVGCKSCQVGCKMTNLVALGPGRIQVYQIGAFGEYPDLQMYFVPVMCQQCENPSCMAVCPTGACHRDQEDGVVRIDPTVCIACESCHNACPYHIPTMNNELRVMDKCNVCQNTSEIPTCEKHCIGRCIAYGDIDDPQSEVSRLLAEAGEENVYTLEDQGNKPSVRYILTRAKWQDFNPVNYQDMKKEWYKL